MAGNWSRNSKAITYIGLTLIIFAAVACGSASAPADTAPAPAVPAAAEQAAVPAPDKAAASAPAASASVAPTAIPKTMTEPAEAPAEVNPGKLTVMVGDLGNERFDQTFVGGTPGFGNYGSIVHGTLITSSEERSVIPGIATEWGLSADGLAWTFTLREGVKFHDGSELTPEDVLWSLEHYYGPGANDYRISPSRFAEHLDRLELSGPDEVSWVFKRPFVEIANEFSELGGLKHIMPARAKQQDSEVEVAYDKNPIAAGFMRVVSHTPAEVMRFERFGDFYFQPANGFPEDKRVNFQSLDMFLVPEESTRVASVRSGQADIAPVNLAAREQIEAEGGRLVFGQEGVYHEVRWEGCDKPEFPCHDKRVRRAMQFALNRELIRDTLYGGPEVFQIKGWSRATPSSNAYTPELDASSPFDPDKARELLADAGYPGGDGFGKLIVNTAPSTAMPFLTESAQLGSEFWKRELGLDVEVRVSDRTQVKKAGRAGELDGQIQWVENETKTDLTSHYTSKYGDRSITKSLSSVHNDPELFGLVHSVVEILDRDKRDEAMRKLVPRLVEEAYELSVGYINIPWGVGPSVLTWQPYPVSTYPSALHTITLK
jgi:peptide/nickel transport system substrate-binding protein